MKKIKYVHTQRWVQREIDFGITPEQSCILCHICSECPDCCLKCDHENGCQGQSCSQPYRENDTCRWMSWMYDILKKRRGGLSRLRKFIPQKYIDMYEPLARKRYRKERKEFREFMKRTEKYTIIITIAASIAAAAQAQAQAFMNTQPVKNLRIANISGGTFKFNEFMGDYKNGMPTRGTYTFGNGDTYTGTFEDGTPKYGRYTFSNGDVYTGNFRNGKRNGTGTYRFADGTAKGKVWVEDK